MSFFSFLWAWFKTSLPVAAGNFFISPIFAAIFLSGLCGLGGQGAVGADGVAKTEKGMATDEDRTFGNSVEMWMQAQAILAPVCMKYLETFCSANEREKWNEKMARRIAQSLEESAEASEESWLQRLALDWAAGNEKRVRRKDPEATKEACLIFERFIRKGIPPPWQIREGLTMKNVRGMVKDLEAIIAARKKGASVEEAHKASR